MPYGEEGSKRKQMAVRFLPPTQSSQSEDSPGMYRGAYEKLLEEHEKLLLAHTALQENYRQLRTLQRPLDGTLEEALSNIRVVARSTENGDVTSAVEKLCGLATQGLSAAFDSAFANAQFALVSSLKLTSDTISAIHSRVNALHECQSALKCVFSADPLLSRMEKLRALKEKAQAAMSFDWKGLQISVPVEEDLNKKIFDELSTVVNFFVASLEAASSEWRTALGAAEKHLSDAIEKRKALQQSRSPHKQPTKRAREVEEDPDNLEPEPERRNIFNLFGLI